jgi:hypothetical protein
MMAWTRAPPRLVSSAAYAYAWSLSCQNYAVGYMSIKGGIICNKLVPKKVQAKKKVNADPLLE